jgi:hypothetical protein
VMLRPGLYLADGQHHVNVPLSLCSCRDFKKLNSGRFRVRCEHLIAAGSKPQPYLRELFASHQATKYTPLIGSRRDGDTTTTSPTEDPDATR